MDTIGKKEIRVCSDGKRLLEICVDSVESAIIAERAGADRLEVCANLVIGGTTPGVSQFRQIRQACGIPLHVLIRPRFGDFLYTDAEFTSIEEDISLFRKLGADGVVVGCLLPDGNLDVERLKRLRQHANGMHLTLHRAFDLCQDPYRALEEAVAFGADTILTSGQQDTCIKGKELLQKLIKKADGRIEILVGSGVNAASIRLLSEEICAACFHMSGKKELDSGMVYRKEQMPMGLPGLSEFTVYRTDRKLVQEAKKALEQYGRSVSESRPSSF